MSSSVSFRITRTAEDLAQTITAITQRLVKLEQQQEALELQLRQQLQTVHNVPDEELATLDGIEQLLQETRHLLQATPARRAPNPGRRNARWQSWSRDSQRASRTS